MNPEHAKKNNFLDKPMTRRDFLQFVLVSPIATILAYFSLKFHLNSFSDKQNFEKELEEIKKLSTYLESMNNEFLSVKHSLAGDKPEEIMIIDQEMKSIMERFSSLIAEIQDGEKRISYIRTEVNNIKKWSLEIAKRMSILFTLKRVES